MIKTGINLASQFFLAGKMYCGLREFNMKDE